MEQAKKVYEEIEEARKIIETLHYFAVENDLIGYTRFSNYYNFLKENLKSSIVRKLIQETILPLVREIEMMNGIEEDPDTLQNIEEQLINEIILEISRLNLNSDLKKSDYTSKSHYEKEKKRLESELNDAKKLESENVENQKKIQNLEQNLKIIKNTLREKDKEIESKNDWEEKITKTFEKLESYLKPLEDEKKKLNVLYFIFLILSVLLVVFLFIIEGVAFHKLTSQSAFPDFKDYIILFIPVPVAGALLWGFIYQMNRAQRQSVVLAKNIHSIKYVEGLLLAINTLSPAVNDGITRVNAALDKMIDNHLSLKDENCELDLLEEEKKDSMPLDSALKIIDKFTQAISKK